MRSELSERAERLSGVQVARSVLAAGFGLELLLVGREGPLAHAKGGVMSGSSELCRAVLFSREGFARCDAFYRGLAAEGGEGAHACHLGLTVLREPIEVGGEVIGQAVASGFLAPGLRGLDPIEPSVLAAALRELDPFLLDPMAPVRRLPVLGSDRPKVVRAILKAAAEEIARVEGEARRKLLGSAGEGGEGEIPQRMGIVGASGPMQAVFALMDRVVKSDASVLIRGESGTGKELVARALHEHGPRRGRPFVAQSCAAVGDSILESTLFGHVRGAFSGAMASSEGLFGAADGGTLFLDEVGEMSQAMQAKLLRVLQDKRYLPVGSTKSRRADVRVIAASHRDLEAMVREGSFRQDLFYRLHVLPIHLPPLRDRPGDLDLLLRSFMSRVGGLPPGISSSARACLLRYPWPGNVRELRAEVERWAVVAGAEAEIGPEHLSPPIREAGGFVGQDGGRAAAAAAAGEGSLKSAVESLERAILKRGLERTEGNRSRLARELGISRTTLNERIARYALE